MLCRRWPAAVVLAIVAVAAEAVPSAGQTTAARLPAAYLAALASYRAGDLAAAFARLEEVGEFAMADITRRLLQGNATDEPGWPRLLTAASLLHTEAYLIRAEAGGGAAGDPYLVSAYSLVRRLIQLAEDGESGIGERERRFVRDWYLLMVSVQHGRAEIGWSRAYLAEAMKSFPKDADLALARGSDHELLSDLSAGFLNHVDARGRPQRQAAVDRDDELREAIRWLEQAVATAPKLMEARLRLGRLLYRRGDLDRAAKELEVARQLAPLDGLRYLALVFGGMVEAARGNYDQADGFYTDALRLFPTGQAAAVAKAETAYLRGRAGEAAATIQATLRQTDKEDPWWVYLSGESWHLEHRLMSIRSYARP